MCWGGQFYTARDVHNESAVRTYYMMMMSMTKCIAGEGVGCVDYFNNVFDRKQLYVAVDRYFVAGCTCRKFGNGQGAGSFV